MEESRKVYGWLVRDRNAAAGCSSMWVWRGMVSSKQWKLGLVFHCLFSWAILRQKWDFRSVWRFSLRGQSIVPQVRHNTYYMVFNNPIDRLAEFVVKFAP